MGYIKCKCSLGNCEGNSDFCIEKDGYCFTSVKPVQNDFGDVEIETEYGCFPSDIEGMLQCKGSLVPHSIPQNISCCKTNFCNSHINLTIDMNKLEKILIEETSDTNWLAFSIVGLVVLTILVFFIFYLYQHRSRKPKDIEKIFSESDDSMDKIAFPYNRSDTPCKQLLPYNYEPKYDFSNYLNHPTFITNNSSSFSDGSNSASMHYKYASLNNSHSHSSSNNWGNSMSNQYRTNSSSITSNTTSSYASEITQQTTLSSQKPTSLPPVCENSISSGSGSGVPRLIQQTLAKEIRLEECIGKGRYGNVWRGTRKGENMAVKIFYSKDEASWHRENEIYTKVIMRQENILGFLGADVTSRNHFTELFLITEYCPMGSLYDYLSHQPIGSVSQLVSLMKSIISGLSHLHTEIIGTIGKPAIAHRDIKSKNILMKSDLSCCIGDFGLAVIKTDASFPRNIKVGTKRYMSPEILNEELKSDEFASYLSSDIYSLALVYWELVNRLEVDGANPSEYHVPFFDLVPNDPDFSDMHQVVCVKKLRPSFDNSVLKALDQNSSKIFTKIITLISECWSQNPSSRKTSLRIKKDINMLTDWIIEYSC